MSRPINIPAKSHPFLFYLYSCGRFCMKPGKSNISPQRPEQTLHNATLVVVRNIINARVRDELQVGWLTVLVWFSTAHHQPGEAH